MVRFAKALFAGVGSLALAACAFWVWLQHKIAYIGPGYIQVTPNRPRLITVSLLIFATAFCWQYHTFNSRSSAPHAVSRLRALVLLVINLLGSIGYLIAVSTSWAIPQERESGIHSITGEPFVWAFSGWPILALFFLVNLSWAVFILFERRWQEGRSALIALLIWLAALLIDFAHH